MFKTTALIAEFVIIGILSTTIMFLIILLSFNVNNLDFLDKAKDYTAIALILFTLVSYIFGIISHRLLNLFPSGWIGIIIKEKIRFRNVLRYKRKNIDGIDWFYTFVSHVSKEDSMSYLTILQYGSTNLIEKISFYESIVRILKSVQYLIPVLGILSIIWTSKMYDYNAYLLYVIVILITVFSVISFNIQLKMYKDFVKESLCMLAKEKNQDNNNKTSTTTQHHI